MHAPLDLITTRRSPEDVVVTATFDSSPVAVYAAWTDAARFPTWWVPASCGLRVLACTLDVRVGGAYRIVFAVPGQEEPVPFFGTYEEVEPASRLTWTNEESPDGARTTVTFAAVGARTEVTLVDRYPTAAALDAAIASGSTATFGETFGQLAAHLARS